MKAPQAVATLGALAQDTRLALFRLLVQRSAGSFPKGAVHPLTLRLLAVTVARALTDTFAGIRPDGVLGFVLAQLAGAAAAALVMPWLLDDPDAVP